MLPFPNLFDCIREYIGYIAMNEGSVCYLTYNPRLSVWSFYDGTKTDEVWNVHNCPETISILRLEPDAAAATLRVESPSDLSGSLTSYSVFTASRPHMTGLHHFISVPEPDSIRSDRLEEKDQLPS